MKGFRRLFYLLYVRLCGREEERKEKSRYAVAGGGEGRARSCPWIGRAWPPQTSNGEEDTIMDGPDPGRGVDVSAWPVCGMCGLAEASVEQHRLNYALPPRDIGIMRALVTSDAAQCRCKRQACAVSAAASE